MIKSVISDVNNFILNRKIVIYSILFCLLAGFGFKVFNYAITLDNDWNIIMASEKPFSNIDFFFYGNGRYISGFLRKIFSINGAFVPYISAFMATVFLGLSAIIICVIIEKLFERKLDSISLISFIAMYLSVPLLYSQNFAFDLGVDIDYLMTLIVTIIAYYLTFKVKIKSYAFLFCSIMTVFAFNVSQSRVVQYLSLYFCILLLNLINKKEFSLKEMLSFSYPFIICGINGLIGYFIITKIGAIIMNVQYSYIEGMIGWTNDQGIYFGLLNIARAIKKIFWYEAPYGAIYNFITLCVFSISIIKILLSKKIKQKLYIIIVFFLFFISNFSLCIVLGNNMPYRTFVGLPIFLGIGWFISIQELRLNRSIQIVAIVTCTLIFSKSILLLNTFFYSSYQTAELEKMYAIEIAHDIISKNNGEIPFQPVIFVGNYDVSTPQSVRFEGVGSTMLNWYEPIRKYNIMEVYGYRFNSTLMYSEEANERAETISLTMPSWPADESIYVSNEMIIVKLSGPIIKEYTGDKELSLMDYNNCDGQEINMWIDDISYQKNIFSIYGWAYIVGLNSEYTSFKIAFIGEDKQYIMSINKNFRPDVDKAYNPLLSGLYNHSGINEEVSLQRIDKGEYEIKLILQNGEKRLINSLNKKIYIE